MKADDTKYTVDAELAPRLGDAKRLTDNVDDLNLRIRANLDMVNAGLDMLPEGKSHHDQTSCGDTDM